VWRSWSSSCATVLQRRSASSASWIMPKCDSAPMLIHRDIGHLF
jgi:hypothetical protein